MSEPGHPGDRIRTHLKFQNLLISLIVGNLEELAPSLYYSQFKPEMHRSNVTIQKLCPLPDPQCHKG